MTEQQHSWIHRHLSGYMVVVFVIDIVLGGLWLSMGNYPAPVENYWMILIDCAIIVNTIPPIAFVAKWIIHKCSGVYWPVKFASMVGIAGSYMLVVAIMGQMYADSLPYPELPEKPALGTSYKTLPPGISSGEVLTAIKSVKYCAQCDLYWDGIDLFHRERATADPIAYVGRGSHLLEYPPLKEMAIIIDEPVPGYEEKIAKWEEATAELQTKRDLRDSINWPFRTIGSFGFVFLLGGGVGAGGMAFGITVREANKQ